MYCQNYNNKIISHHITPLLSLDCWHVHLDSTFPICCIVCDKITDLLTDIIFLCDLLMAKAIHFPNTSSSKWPTVKLVGYECIRILGFLAHMGSHPQEEA